MMMNMTQYAAQPPPLRVVIAEDYEWARMGIRLSIQQKSTRCQVVGEAENGQEAIELVKKLNPDVVLMDVSMPVMDGIAATEEIKKTFPDTKLIMLTSFDDMQQVSGSLYAGADGYCMKDITIERLLQVIEMVSNGAIWLDPSVAGILAKMQANKSIDQTDKSVGVDLSKASGVLTRREEDVLALMVEGNTNKEIASKLCISNHTVKIHVSHIIQKLAVEDRTQVVIKALREGLIQPQSSLFG